jgi:dihydrodipicolinate synthase/N-acetylneuraminate lyase
MTKPTGGVFAVPTTPFDTDGTQNIEALTTRVTEVLETGVTGILCLGATGEALALSDEEREAQIRAVVGTLPETVRASSSDAWPTPRSGCVGTSRMRRRPVPMRS